MLQLVFKFLNLVNFWNLSWWWSRIHWYLNRLGSLLFFNNPLLLLIKRFLCFIHTFFNFCNILDIFRFLIDFLLFLNVLVVDGSFHQICVWILATLLSIYSIYANLKLNLIKDLNILLMDLMHQIFPDLILAPHRLYFNDFSYLGAGVLMIRHF